MLIRAVESLNNRLGALAGVGTVLLMFSVVPDLLARSLFGVAIYGMSESSIMLLVFIVFLALPVAQLRKEHFYVAVLDGYLSRANLRRIRLFRSLASAVITGVFAWYSVTSAWDSVMRLEQSYAVIEFPVWPAKIAVACGFVLLMLQFLFDAVLLYARSPSRVDREVQLDGDVLVNHSHS